MRRARSQSDRRASQLQSKAAEQQLLRQQIAHLLRRSHAVKATDLSHVRARSTGSEPRKQAMAEELVCVGRRRKEEVKLT